MERPTPGMVAGAAGQVLAAAGLAWAYDRQTDMHRLSEAEVCLRLAVPPLALALLLGRWALLLPALQARDGLVLFRLDPGGERATERTMVGHYRAALAAGALAAAAALVADARHGAVAAALCTALLAGHALELLGLGAGVHLERGIIRGWRAACGAP